MLRGFEWQLQGCISGIQRQDDQLRSKAGELRIVHQQGLTVHAIRRDVHRERQPALQARDANGRHQMIHGMRRQQGDAQRLQPADRVFTACQCAQTLACKPIQPGGEGEVAAVPGELRGQTQANQGVGFPFGLADGGAKIRVLR